MKTYKIGVVWQMYGSVEVEANSLAEAIHIVHSRDVPLPENGEYIDFALKRELLQAEMGDSARVVHELGRDLQVKKALEYLKDSKLYHAALAKNKGKK